MTLEQNRVDEGSTGGRFKEEGEMMMMKESFAALGQSI